MTGVSVVFFTFVAITLLGESLWPLHRVEGRAQRYAFHAGLFVVNATFCRILLGQPLYLYWEHLSGLATAPPLASALPSLATLFLTLLIFDFSSYWIHRASHHFSALFRFHRVHHSDTVVDATSALRDHSLQLLAEGILFGLPLLLWRPTRGDWWIYNFTALALSIFHHANLRLPPNFESLLSRVIVTPRFHRRHHEQGRASNFGGIFSFWDRCFGTFVPGGHETAAPPYGLVGFAGESLSFRHTLLGPWNISERGLGVLWCLLFILPMLGCRVPGFSKPFQEEKISSQLQAEIDYGRDVFIHTAQYLGPKGSVAANNRSRMNCQNCHLNAGTKRLGFNLSSAHGRYPEYRAREGKVMTLEARINSCFERPLNGRPLAGNSREMLALQAYFRFLALGVPVGSRSVEENATAAISWIPRAADPRKGEAVYTAKCARCHGVRGEGILNAEGEEFVYPPLWGPESYNLASNMFRVSKLAGFIRANMPLGATVEKPELSNEEAFDAAAFIVDMKQHPRPLSEWKEYVNASEKPIDYPFGPYDDTFSEEQHKYGPFEPILHARQEAGKSTFY